MCVHTKKPKQSEKKNLEQKRERTESALKTD